MRKYVWKWLWIPSICTRTLSKWRELARERQIENARDEKKKAFKSRSDTAHSVCSKGLPLHNTKIFPISKTEMSHRTKRIDNNRLIALLSFHFRIFAYPFGMLLSVRSYFIVYCDYYFYSTWYFCLLVFVLECCIMQFSFACVTQIMKF